jgi:tetratricopeptide (TPR) repeat protein
MKKGMVIKMKRLFRPLMALLFVFWVCLLVNYLCNEAMIKNYNEGNYTINEMDFLGFTETYIAAYNRGNVYYQTGDYEIAVNKYYQALKEYPSHKEGRECDIRVNLALSLVAQIDLAALTKDNYKAALKLIDEAREVLLDEECATNDDDGHDRDAQQLKDQLDEFEQQIRDQFESEEPTPTPTPTATPSPTPTPDSTTPTPTPTQGPDSPTPTPTNVPDGATPTPTPSPIPDITGFPTLAPGARQTYEDYEYIEGEIW